MKRETNPVRRLADVVKAPPINIPDASLRFKLLEDDQSEKLLDENSTLTKGEESKIGKCFPKTETTIAPDTGKFEAVDAHTTGFTKDNAPDNIKLGDRPMVTMAAVAVPDPAEMRHLSDESDSHNEN